MRGEFIDYAVNYYFDKGLVKHRFFNEKCYAKDFLRGRIRLSTLTACRNLENPIARDTAEGNVNVSSGTLYFDSTSNPEHKEILEDLSMLGISGCGEKITIGPGDFGTKRLDDAYIICLSNTANEHVIKSFGKFSVQMAFTSHICQLICRELNLLFLDKPGFREGIVQYDDAQQVTLSEGSIREKIGFVKHLRFKPEDEYRLLFKGWRKKKIEPVFVEVGDISRFCRLVEY